VDLAIFLVAYDTLGLCLHALVRRLRPRVCGKFALTDAVGPKESLDYPRKESPCAR
jgi:hypothetical protein